MTIFFPRCCSMEGESAFSLLPCGEQIGLAGLASPCHLFLKGAKETAKMSESSSEDLNDVKLSSHEGNWVPSMGEKSRRSDEGNRVPLRCQLRKSKGSGAGRGTTFPRTPLSTASWMQRAPGKSIRGLQHPQLGEVLVDLEKLITQNAGCFAPLKTNVRVIVRGS